MTWKPTQLTFRWADVHNYTYHLRLRKKIHSAEIVNENTLKKLEPFELLLAIFGFYQKLSKSSWNLMGAIYHDIASSAFMVSKFLRQERSSDLVNTSKAAESYLRLNGLTVTKQVSWPLKLEGITWSVQIVKLCSGDFKYPLSKSTRAPKVKTRWLHVYVDKCIYMTTYFTVHYKPALILLALESSMPIPWVRGWLTLWNPSWTMLIAQ